MNYPQLMFAALMVIFLLAVYAIYLAFRLRQQTQKREQLLEQQKMQRERDNQEARQSIQIIARALMQKDLTDTEAAMRIAFLSQKLQPSEEEASALSIFLQLSEATAHIPILDDWTALERSEKKRLNREREDIESRYSEFIHASAKVLATISLGGVSSAQ
jgi:hypothetical protein